MDANGFPAPNGFCIQACEGDGDCGEGACMPSGLERLCFERCSARTPCRDGWTCVTQARADANLMPEQIEMCVPDCTLTGCGGAGVCDIETGRCAPFEVEPPPECAYPCGRSELCTDGRCVRADSTCETDYHCGLDEACRDGVCITAMFAPCNPDLPACHESQTCLPLGDGTGICMFSCEDDDVCEVNQGCQTLVPEASDVCYFVFCEPDEINGPCQLSPGRVGTCQPLRGDDARGLCVDAGVAAVGGVCDGQADPRVPAQAELACGTGALCVGDPDDPIEPDAALDGRGECTELCRPGVDRCGPGQACVDFGARDDPRTVDEDENWDIGLCQPSDCDIFDGGCGRGDACRILSFLQTDGLCERVGPLGLGEACEETADCGDRAQCLNAGNGPVCLQLCEPELGDCPLGQACIAGDIGWQVNVCF